MTLVQHITPEVLQWIAAQAQAGHAPESVLRAMRDSGWDDHVARLAIDRSKRGRSPEELPAAVPVPEPDPTDARCVLRTPDREVRVLMAMRSPRLMVLGGLLSDAECDGIVELARPQLARSGTVDTWSGGDHLSERRTSEGMFFKRAAHPLVARVEARIAHLVSWPLECGEGLQVLRYTLGTQYYPHHDYFDPTVPSTPAILNRGGQRVATIVMCLRAPTDGGSTVFPDVGVRVPAVKGNAVFFSYDRAHPDSLTLHGGAPVIEGEKWVATKWLRERAFE
jgi:prolyl 4-hydroxylase